MPVASALNGGDSGSFAPDIPCRDELFPPDNPFLLAPLAGITDMPFRKLCHEQGAALVFSEMVSAKALHYGDRKSFELLVTEAPNRGNRRPEVSAVRRRSEPPIAFQFFGSEPEIMAEAVLLTADYPNIAIDINMGCPVPKVVKNGEGSALMKDPELAARIVEAMSAAARKPVTAGEMSAAPRKPVTVKMRTGWDAGSVNAVEFAQALEAAGAEMITVHGRTREQYYTGKADWGIIAAVKRAVNIPVCGSGDVFTARDAVRMLTETGCDGVMIARGALGNPWIFRDAKLLLSGASDADVAGAAPTPHERAEMFTRQLDLTAELKSEKIAVLEMRKHAGWYFKGLPGISAFRARVNRITDIGELRREVAGFCEKS